MKSISHFYIKLALLRFWGKKNHITCLGKFSHIQYWTNKLSYETWGLTSLPRMQAACHVELRNLIAENVWIRFRQWKSSKNSSCFNEFKLIVMRPLYYVTIPVVSTHLQELIISEIRIMKKRCFKSGCIIAHWCALFLYTGKVYHLIPRLYTPIDLHWLASSNFN